MGGVAIGETVCVSIDTICCAVHFVDYVRKRNYQENVVEILRVLDQCIEFLQV